MWPASLIRARFPESSLGITILSSTELLRAEARDDEKDASKESEAHENMLSMRERREPRDEGRTARYSRAAAVGRE